MAKKPKKILKIFRRPNGKSEYSVIEGKKVTPIKFPYDGIIITNVAKLK